MFDWPQFLDQRGIPYATSGPNVSRGRIAIKCCFCSDDPSQHLTIDLEGRGWRCWRNHDHKGISPVRLIQALTGCSMDQARAAVGITTHIPDDFAALIHAKLDPPSILKGKKMRMPENFKEIRSDKPSARPYIKYLEGRGYTRSKILSMSMRYGIRYCTQGAYKGRIIFPVEHDMELVSWTGRSIFPNARMRYKALTTDDETAHNDGLEPAIGPISHYLLWYDDLMESPGDTLVLCEGPFDALKVRVLGAPYGIDATCFFTAEPTNHQIDLLHTLLPRFDRRYLLLDRGAVGTSIKVARKLAGLDITVKEVTGAKDPGDLKDLKSLLSLFA